MDYFDYVEKLPPPRKAHNFKDMMGQTFGRLTVIEEHPERTKNRQAQWICKCDCGNTVIVRGQHLCSGNSTSCGCAHKEAVTKHGMNNTPTYRSWINMLQRCCNNPKNKAYKYYGARGITICERWLTFENFFEDMGEKPKGLTIERMDNDLGYYKENCKWATPKEQSNNTRPVIAVRARCKQAFSELFE